jgi:hypothetical protein
VRLIRGAADLALGILNAAIGIVFSRIQASSKAGFAFFAAPLFFAG